MTFFGKHLLRSTATTQGVLALSSGESEFYAVVKTSSIGSGSVHMVRDMGVKMDTPLEIYMDATAGIGIASRRGVGRIRHIHTPALWLQRTIHEGRVVLNKVKGTVNPADIGTKYVDSKTILQAWKQMGFVLLEGRSDLALRSEAVRNKAVDSEALDEDMA